MVLYAPTWRDNRKNSSGEYDATWLLDPERLRERLGPEWIVLYRGHVNVSRAAPPNCPGVLDVSSYPDINDLYAAADVMVTDYSSVMFDWVLTKKPIYFLVPDLLEYETNVRGFYYDFRKIAPGPLVSNTIELADLLAMTPEKEGLSANYEEFRDRFAGLDDGSAAARVFAKVWR